MGQVCACHMAPDSCVALPPDCNKPADTDSGQRTETAHFHCVGLSCDKYPDQQTSHQSGLSAAFTAAGN